LALGSISIEAMNQKKISVIFICSFLLLFVYSEVLSATALYLNKYIAQSSPQNTLIRFIRQHAKNKTIIFIDMPFDLSQIVSYYGHAKLSHAIDLSLSIVPAIVNDHFSLPNLRKKAIDNMAQSLKTEKPALIFVDNAKKKLYLHYPFDYIAFYSQSALFRSEWRHYQKINQLGRFAIYARKQE
jgi:hypothetical protein